MKKDYTLLILAAGMGSRFGGLKQIEGMGPNGEFIIDYSIFDAKEAGFTKVVFLIQEKNYEVFKETIGKRVENHIKVEYCFQNNDNVPSEFTIPKTRVKPLGTAHAILCCKEKIHEPFAIINADDFYGKDAYKKAIEFLKKDHEENTYGLVGYKTKNTLSENGSVKRGVCKTKENRLISLIESKIWMEDDKIIGCSLHNDKKFELKEDDTVSMNMLLFYETIFDFIEKKFPDFLGNKENLESGEFLIPEVLEQCIEEDYAKVEVTPTTSSWYGVTYKEDKESVVNAISQMIEKNIYKKNLWD